MREIEDQKALAGISVYVRKAERGISQERFPGLWLEQLSQWYTVGKTEGPQRDS